MTEIVALSKYVHLSPKKIRLVADAIVALKPEIALQHLKLMNKSASLPLFLTLKSAIANAENNLKLDKSKLKIKTIEVTGGPFLKRFRAVSRGTAHQYKRRTSHIKIVLEDQEVLTKGEKSGTKDKS